MVRRGALRLGADGFREALYSHRDNERVVGIGMADGASILTEVERLEKSVREHDRAVDSLLRQRKDAKKRLGNPLVDLLVLLLLTAFLTSSCTLHAGELLGRWDIEGVVELLTAPLRGIVAWAKTLGTAPYLIAAVVTAAIDLPLSICVLFASPLRIIEMLLEMHLPAAVSYLAYVEIALNLLTFLYLLRLSGTSRGERRALKARIRDIDEQMQRHRNQSQQEGARLRALKSSQEYAEAKHAQEAREALYASIEEHADAFDYMTMRDLEASLPDGIDLSTLDRYVKEDIVKARLVAEHLKRGMDPLTMEHGISRGDLTEKEYLADFDRCFRSMSKRELCASVGISEELIRAFGVDLDG